MTGILTETPLFSPSPDGVRVAIPDASWDTYMSILLPGTATEIKGTRPLTSQVHLTGSYAGCPAKICEGYKVSASEINGVKLPPVEQIGIVVRDLDRAIEYYSSTFGWGPFEVHLSDMKGVIYRGRPTDCKLRLAMARSGPIEIELIQVLEGETPHTEFLKKKGEGLHHLRFRVEDLDGILEKWARQGIQPVWSLSYPEFGVSFAYVDTTAIGGVMIELIEWKGKPSEARSGN